MNQFLESPEEVLSTLGKDGKRKWLYPKLVSGFWHKRRQVLAFILIGLYVAAPFIKINGKPLILLNIIQRQFSFFGKTFVATDTFVFLLTILCVLISVVLLTALLGRVWCGWACPQTVYLEFVYRPIERFFQGSPIQQKKLNEGPWTKEKVYKKGLTYLCYLVISVTLANAFIAYFIGGETLLQWVQLSPLKHPIPFLIMAGVTAAMIFDFAFFREQMCTIACPYARIQSVLLDGHSIIVGYDESRGEPRGKGKDRDGKGDCVDCSMCVQVCPTGIDIRKGLQMECLHCTQCVDACDSIMAKIGKPLGLIRYASKEEFAGNKTKYLRPRVIFYFVIVCILFSVLSYKLSHLENTQVKVLRRIGEPFIIREDGNITNHMRVKIHNKSDNAQSYYVSLIKPQELEVVIPLNPIKVESQSSAESNVFISYAKDTLTNGSAPATLQVSSDSGFINNYDFTLTGPKDGN